MSSPRNDTGRGQGRASGRVPEWTMGDRLAKARTQAGMSQDDMARALYRARRTIYSWEHDETRPSKLHLLRWAEVTGIAAEWIESGHAERQTGITTAA